jgi:hypothetical protein
MQVYCRGYARIRSKATGSVLDVERNEINWGITIADEREMGSEICYKGVVEHPELGRLAWSVWEYPKGIESRRHTDVGEHELVEDFEYGLEHVREPDVWGDYALPDDPFAIFMDTYYTADYLLGDHHRVGNDLLNRMIFTHYVTALEAYLADTLIKAVLADTSAMTRLVTEDSELKKEKFSLAEIAANPDLVKTKVSKYLRLIIYHDLRRVDFLYAAALGISILSLGRDNARLLETIRLRQDCVHRNGRDSDGKALTVFTREYVQDTSDLIKELVVEIQKKLKARVGHAAPAKH